MKEIHIGTKIADRRRQKGITQEELASFLCVSKPAVSKWESGQSYPDITLLPVLASYFNTTVDELLGYEPQMTKEEIKKLYKNMANAFAKEPFEKVYAMCEEYAKKYYSCWNLQLHIGLLFVNHANLAGGAEKAEAVIKEAEGIFDRITREGDDIGLSRVAVSMRALCFLCLNQPVMAIDLLEGMVQIPISTEVLLARAYAMKGDGKKAKSLVQRYIYQNVMGIVGACPDFMALYADDPLKAEDCCKKAAAVGELFEVEKMQPSVYLLVFLTAAQLYAMQGEKEKALDMLEKYVNLAVGPKMFPIELHGNDFFDLLDDYFDSLDLGTSPPRNEKVILQSVKESVLNNPAFEGLRPEERYRRLAKKLDEFC